MKRTSQNPIALRDEDEPMGIVISRGPVVEQAPMFAAYIWSAEPEPEVEATPAQAA